MPDTSDWQSLFPFESHWLDVDGHRMHYLDEGEGPPLLMVHGNPTWSFYWRNLVRALREDFRVVAIDHIGCGLSDKPSVYPYSLAQHTNNLSSLIEQLDLQNITLMAHDWGGAIGLGAVTALRQRFDRLILFNTAAFPPPFFPWRIRLCRTPLLGKLAVQGWNVFARAAIQMAVEKHDRMTPAVRAGLLAPYNSWHNRRAIYAFIRDIPWSRRHPTYQVLARLEQQLAELSALPTLLVWGMRDWCFRPACLDRFAQHFPDAHTVRLEDAGHYVVEDAHERIVREVKQFLQQHPVETTAPAGDYQGG